MRISDWSSDVCSSDLRLDHRPPSQAAGLLRPRVLAGEDLRAPADLRPVAGALCDQLRVRARSGLPAAAAVDGSGLSRLLRAGGRLPRGQPRPEERAATDLHRLRRGAGADPVQRALPPTPRPPRRTGGPDARREG